MDPFEYLISVTLEPQNHERISQQDFTTTRVVSNFYECIYLDCLYIRFGTDIYVNQV